MSIFELSTRLLLRVLGPFPFGMLLAHKIKLQQQQLSYSYLTFTSAQHDNNMKIIITSFALVYAATSTASADSDTCNNLDYAYPNDIPWVAYQGDDYIFTRQKYNSVCVDSQGREFEYGTFQGVYTPIDETGGGCSTVCVE